MSSTFNMYRKRSSGFTIMEMIIVMAFLAIAMTAVFYGFNAAMDIFNMEMYESDSAIEAHRGMEHITKELQNCLAITTPGVRYITFWYQDYNGNGTIDANELVSYTWDATAQFLNRTQSSSTFAVAKGVTFFALTYDVTADINLITVWITTKKNTGVTTLESSVRARNL